MTSKEKALDNQDYLYLQRKFRYAMEIVAQGGDATEYLMRKCGPLLGLSTFEKELEEAYLRLGVMND